MAAVVAATYGQSTINGNAAGQYTFADRYGYVAVTNTGTAAITVTADGSTPEAAGTAGTAITVPAGATKFIANGLLLWFQSARVIPAGVNQFGNGNTASSPASPGMVQSQRSLAGSQGAASNNPGTIINVAGTTPLFSLEGTG